MRSRIKCFVVCLGLLVSVLGFCSCGSNDGDAGEEAKLMHIIITYPNSSEIYVDGRGTARSWKYCDYIRADIDGKAYWTSFNNVLVVDGE